MSKHPSEDELMDIDPDIDLSQYDDDVGTVPRYISSTTTASSITSNRELLSKFIDYYEKENRKICSARRNSNVLNRS